MALTEPLAIAVDGFLPVSTCRLIQDYTLMKHALGQLRPADQRVLDAPCIYGDPLSDVILSQQCPIVEAHCGRALFPTFSYIRLHFNGATLKEHTDRPAAEFTVSVNVATDVSWPLWIRRGGAPLAFSLDVGSAFIFQGQQLPHWRESFAGENAIQLLLCYVDRGGPHSALAWDGRAKHPLFSRNE